jgi:hypothetical protein
MISSKSGLLLLPEFFPFAESDLPFEFVDFVSSLVFVDFFFFPDRFWEEEDFLDFPALSSSFLLVEPPLAIDFTTHGAPLAVVVGSAEAVVVEEVVVEAAHAARAIILSVERFFILTVASMNFLYGTKRSRSSIRSSSPCCIGWRLVPVCFSF